jgi:DNA-binding transcriptional MerR regulator
MDNFPIRVLAEKTGVAPTTLRAWERRYGLLKPERTPKGHRLYSVRDVEVVTRIVKLLNDNYTISKAINEIKLEDIQEQADLDTLENPQSTEHWEVFQKRFLSAIELFDENKLDAIYNEALSLYPIDLVSSQILRPLLSQLGIRWTERKTGIAEEHFFTSYLRNKVGARVHHASGKTKGSRLLLACVPGDYHELGSLLFGLSAMTRGYRLLFLGADLPLDQIKAVTESTDIDGVVLSAVSVNVRGQFARDLSQLADELSCPLMLGGSIPETHLDSVSQKIIFLGNDYRKALETLEKQLPAYR